MCVVCAALIMCWGCGQQAEQTESNTLEGTQEPAAVVDLQGAEKQLSEPVDSVCIREGSAFFKNPGDGFLSYLSEGERLLFLGKKENSKIEGKENWVYSLVQRSDGSQGWTLVEYLVEDAIPGVILRDAALYSQPSAANLTPNEKVYKRQIIGVRQTKDYESYYLARWNVPETYIIKEHYVRKVYVSLSEEDVAVSRLLNIAANDTDRESQIDQLKLILSEFPDSKFRSDVEKALQYITAGEGEENQ